MTKIKFKDTLWVKRLGIPPEKLIPFCEMQLHDHNYTMFTEMPRSNKVNELTDINKKMIYKGTLRFAKGKTVKMIYQRIVDDFNHMGAGTLPLRYRDPNKKRHFSESFEKFRQDFLKSADSDMEFMALYHQENIRKEETTRNLRKIFTDAAIEKEPKERNKLLAFLGKRKGDNNNRWTFDAGKLQKIE